jgi:coproporphyrinogen III oxidase
VRISLGTSEGGGGRTRYRKWSCFEKGGVNVSAVHGKLPEAMQKYLM